MRASWPLFSFYLPLCYMPSRTRVGGDHSV